MKRNFKNQPGFTMIEVMLSIAILTLIMGIIFTAINPAQRYAEQRNLERTNEILQLKEGINRYVLDMNQHPSGLLSIDLQSQANPCYEESYQAYEICSSSAESCTGYTDLSSSISEYVVEIPEDPSDTEENINGTGYVIFRDSSSDEVVVCAPLSELGEFVSSASSQAALQPNLWNGLMGYWPMDGDWDDKTVSGNDGTAHGSASFSGGMYGQGGSFTEITSDYINFGDLEFEMDEITLSLWSKAATNDSGDSLFPIHVTNIIGKGNWNAQNNWFIGYRSSGTNPATTITFAYGVFPNAGPTYSVNNYDLAEWHMFTGTADNTVQNLYLDGDLVDSKTVTRTNTESTYSLQIARSSYAARFYSGLVDDVRIYNRVLEDDEIVNLYNYNPPPIANWQFEEGEGSTTTDSSINGFESSLNNMTDSNWSRGRSGIGLRYTGSAEEGVFLMDSATADIYQNNDTNFSFTLWFKSNTETEGNASAAIISRDCSDYFCFALDQATGSGATVYYSDSENSTAITLDEPLEWHFVAGVWDESEGSFNFYLDGEVEFTDSSLTDFATSERPIVLGGNTEGDEDISGNEFIGYVDEVRFYNYALSQAEIRRVMWSAD